MIHSAPGGFGDVGVKLVGVGPSAESRTLLDMVVSSRGMSESCNSSALLSLLKNVLQPLVP